MFPWKIIIDKAWLFFFSLLKLTLSLQKTFFHAVKCNLLDPTRTGIKTTTVTSEQKMKLGLRESGIQNEIFW